MSSHLPKHDTIKPLLQSFPKETQHFWSYLSFGEECIPVNLGLCMQISHDPRLHDPDPGPQEKSTEKSCVSFGKDCISFKCLVYGEGSLQPSGYLLAKDTQRRLHMNIIKLMRVLLKTSFNWDSEISYWSQALHVECSVLAIRWDHWVIPREHMCS